jgi:hypothetical protein
VKTEAWGYTPHRDTVSDHQGPEDLEALELYERARQGLSRTIEEEQGT